MHRPRRALLLVAALAAVIVTLVVVVDSSDSRDTTNSVRVNASTTATPRSTTSSPATNTRPQAPTTTTTTARATAIRSTPTASAPLRLWVGGDSLAAGPSWAVFEQARATGVVKPLAEYQVGTGLVRSEFWDWPKHMDAVVRARDPEVTVFMVGANDDQPIDVDGTSYGPPDPHWVEEYRRRVDAVMTTLTADGRQLLWIGMPPMRDATYSQSMGVLDEIMQQETTKHRRVVYVDVWTMFSAPGEPGTYAQYVPDESGNLVNMRLDDGIHLNVEGSQRLARAVMTELGKIVNLPS